MRKIRLLFLIMLVFAQISRAETDYAKMPANQLDESIIMAVRRGCSDEVQKLLLAGADGNQTITYDAGMRDWDVNITTTLLEYAAKKGYVDIVKALKLKAKSDDINKALILAAEAGYAAVVKELVQAKPKKDTIDKALVLAANAGNVSVVIELIKAGANVNHADEQGYTAFIGIITYPYKTTEAWKKIRAEAAECLLKAGVDVNYVNKSPDGDTPLIRAIKNHDIDAVKIILNTPGINVNRANNYGSTPLIVALNHIRTSYISGRNDQYNDCVNSQKIVEMLLNTPGVDLNHVNKRGDTAFKLLQEMKSRR